MLRITRRVATLAALGSALALAAGASSASAATTVSGLPDSAPIINKLYVPVALTVTCDYFDFYSSVSVTIRQVVSGKNVAHGTAGVSGLQCDGAAHEYVANVFPDGSSPFGGVESPLFSKGAAVVSAQSSPGFPGTPTGGVTQPITLTK